MSAPLGFLASRRALVSRIIAGRPNHIDLTRDELDALTAYLKTPPPARTVSNVRGTFNAEVAKRFPASIPDPAGTEIMRREFLERVRLANERRLAAALAAAPDPKSEQALTAAKPKRKEPPPEAFEAYRAKKEGMRQKEIAKLLVDRYHTDFPQYKISRLLTRAKEWLKDGNVFPHVDTSNAVKHKQSMDPSILDKTIPKQNNARRKS
jgi:hypothetical protein